MIETDYLVLGSGIAGLSFALHAAEHGKVVIATKRAAERPVKKHQPGVTVRFEEGLHEPGAKNSRGQPGQNAALK